MQGSGFLYKQVRHMTGALLQVGLGKLSLQDIQQQLKVGSSQSPGALTRATAGCLTVGWSALAYMHRCRLEARR